jgi:hypothetical protein
MRARLIAAAGTAALALAGSVLAASPAMAGSCTAAGGPPVTCSTGTTVTFTLSAGSLALSVPNSVNLGSVSTSSAATALSGQLGSSTVTDARGALVGAYTVSFSAGNFTNTTTGGTSPQETILGSTVTAWSGVSSHTSGGTAVDTSSPGVASGLPITSLSLYTGTDTGSYNPSVNIPIPATNVAGVYSGVITQTVVGV